MKTLTAIVVAAALAAPSIASAQRHTTPGTAERHAAAQAQTNANADAQKKSENRRADNEDARNLHINGAKAGKLNLATERSGDGA